MAGVWKIHWKNGLFSRCFLGQYNIKFIFFGLIVVNCHKGHINKQNPARFFKIGSVVPEIIGRPFEKKSFREKRV